MLPESELPSARLYFHAQCFQRLNIKPSVLADVFQLPLHIPNITENPVCCKKPVYMYGHLFLLMLAKVLIYLISISCSPSTDFFVPVVKSAWATVKHCHSYASFPVLEVGSPWFSCWQICFLFHRCSHLSMRPF